MAKVITVKQPWAQLVCIGHKGFETRGWKTNYRGELYIHSSAKLDFNDLELCHSDPDFKMCIPDPTKLVTGHIIGKVDLVGIYPTNQSKALERIVKRMGGLMGRMARREIRFGDYGPDRYAWELENPVLYRYPIPARGNLGIWEYPADELLSHNLVS